MSKPEVFAVVWGDLGIWMHLTHDTADEAIAAAQKMHARSTANSVSLHELRAVHVPAGEDRLVTLWAPPTSSEI